ncbi:hypothetical protein GCM10007424_23520 [Flavobacterium suaedae]|uniref:Uncharacterized protein n=1 Tax=Flavobacterium suaedae TaxID=1767027 RepID=A0ABQ1K0X1_9FLAO|nr:hypothetical protein [Flavobacterium suaedae]GGB82780.1 hypothetical protein GCM10007424_23520 [Flavobacterium suaedae]
MKVELKLKPGNLWYLSSVLEPLTNITNSDFVQKTHDQRTITSILIPVADVFTKKYKNITRKSNLFDAAKKYKVSLLYHECNALNLFLAEAWKQETDDYRKLQAHTIMLQMDKHFT